MQILAGKFIASIFWDKYGILLIDYLPKGQTINAECYLSFLVQLKDILKGKRRARRGHQEGPVLARQPPDCPLDYQLFSGLKTIERSPFFVRHELC
jgi:hypothetical protein